MSAVPATHSPTANDAAAKPKPAAWPYVSASLHVVWLPSEIKVHRSLVFFHGEQPHWRLTPTVYWRLTLAMQKLPANAPGAYEAAATLNSLGRWLREEVGCTKEQWDAGAERAADNKIWIDYEVALQELKTDLDRVADVYQGSRSSRSWTFNERAPN